MGWNGIRRQRRGGHARDLALASATALLLLHCRAGAGPAAPRRLPLRPGLPGVTIAGETRPAIELSGQALELAIPAVPEGSVLRYAVGCKPVERSKKRPMIIAHNARLPATPAPPPALPPPPPTPRNRPKVTASYEIVLVTPGIERRHRVTIPSGEPTWREGEIPLPVGRSRLVVRLSVLTPGDAGETVHLADPTVVTGVPDDRPSAMLISIDSLRADHLGAYGYGAPVSPHLDRLSRQAELFTEAHSTSCWTLPAHVSLLASRYGSEMGAIDPLSQVDRSVPSLAEVASEAGYATFARVNHLLVSERFGFDRGFSVFRRQQNGSADATVSEALALIDSHEGQPWLVFLHLFDPHYDYTPRPPWDRLTEDSYSGSVGGRMGQLLAYFRGAPMAERDREHLVALYDGEIGLTDHALGLLFASLDRRGLRDRTLLLIAADHGEEFKEHGSLGHGLTLYDEQIRVPLLYRAGRSGLRHDAVSLLDAAPTIATALGIGPSASWRGRDLSLAVPSRPLLAENRLFGQDITAAVHGERKVVANFKANPPNFTELDRLRDPRELDPRDDGGDLATYARWLRQAFRPGRHLLAMDRKSFLPGVEPDSDPDSSGLLHAWLGEASLEEDPATVPSGLREVGLKVVSDGKPRAVRLLPAGAAEHAPDDRQLLESLGYLATAP